MHSMVLKSRTPSIPPPLQPTETPISPTAPVSYGITENFRYEFKTKKLLYYLAVPPVRAIMNRMWDVKYTGAERVPRDTPLLVMGNHLSHLDSFILGIGLYPFKPLHAIADEKLFINPFAKFFLTQLNSFPIRKRAKQMHVLRYAIELVKSGRSLVYFPEGQRNKHPERYELMPGKLGSGWISYATKAKVLPVFLSNTELAVPARKGPRVGKGGPRSIKVTCEYGDPLDFSEYYELPESKDTSMLIVTKIMDAIEAMRPKWQLDARKEYYERINQEPPLRFMSERQQ